MSARCLAEAEEGRYEATAGLDARATEDRVALLEALAAPSAELDAIAARLVRYAHGG